MSTEFPEANATALDPVCGTVVSVSDDTPSASYLGNTYFFRTPECRAKSEAEPSPYIQEMAVQRFRAWVWARM